MKALFNCELYYFNNPHLNQIYDGFYKLNKLGIINLTTKEAKGDTTKPILDVVLDKNFTIKYDTLDGFNWINDNVSNNLLFFKENYKCDFYYKRSYNKYILNYSPENCHIYPLGLNYNIATQGTLSPNLIDMLTFIIKNNVIYTHLFRKKSFYSENFEFYPILNKDTKILFLTRLWNPEDVKIEQLRIERECINNNRINCIKACKKTFGSKFLGGIQRDSFSLIAAKDLISPNTITNKEAFLYNIKRHNICIATTGLHDSIGWKFGEYVAASRAIISEPLSYELPGNFEPDKNYLKYTNEDELINHIISLIEDKEKLINIMTNNFHYYNNYLKPEILILNTLLQVYNLHN